MSNVVTTGMTHTATLTSTNVLEINLAIAAVTGFAGGEQFLKKSGCLSPVIS